MEELKKEPVKKGCIYKWHEGMADERFVLAISADARGNERMISVIMFGTSGTGRDVVKVNNSALGDICYLHCGMITYVTRQDMADKPVAKLGDKKMLEVDRQLCIQLGITNEDTLAELRFYKRKCDELIEKYTGMACDL